MVSSPRKLADQSSGLEVTGSLQSFSQTQGVQETDQLAGCRFKLPPQESAFFGISLKTLFKRQNFSI
jgi:hypothetical protein